MKLLELKERGNFDLLKNWCLTIYNYMLFLDSSFSLEVEWFKGVIVDAEKTTDIKLMKRVYKETNVLVRETLTPRLIEPLNKILKEKYGHDIADEMELETATIQKIIKRGKIRNDNEFEMVKRREEEIYADDSQCDYAESLRHLMADYEVPKKITGDRSSTSEATSSVPL